MPALSIRQRLRLLILLTLILLAAIWALNRHSQQQWQDGEQARTVLASMALGLTSLRRHERDFIAARSLDDVDAFGVGMARFREDLAVLRQLAQKLGLDQATLAPLDPAMTGYRDSFLTLVEKQREIGLDQDSGLYGALRQAAAAMEQVVQEIPSLYAPLLLLRRHEKDFMLQRNDLWYTRFMTSLSDFRGQLMFSDLDTATLARVQTSLRHYVDAFDTLSQYERDIGLQPHHGLHGAMARQVTEAEAAFARLDRQLQERLADYHRQASLRAALAVLAVMSVLALSLMWLARDLMRRLQQAVTSATALGAGNWQQPIRSQRDDELGAVLAALEQTRQELVSKAARLDADHRLRQRQAELGNLLQGLKSPQTLAEDVIRYLTPALGCQVGALYQLDGEELHFVAGYGITRQTTRQARLAVGEGLAGQCARQRRLMRLENLPGDYLAVVSGTGSCTPATLLIAPLVWNNELFGVIELGATDTPDADADTLLSVLGEAIAVALNAANTRLRMAELLQHHQPADSGTTPAQRRLA